MAKAKSKKIMLEDAIVPVDEQPYQIPENWCWTFLSNVADWGSGGTPSRKNPDYYGGYIPWIKTGELEDGYIFDSEEKITEDAVAHSSAKLFPIDSVLIAMYGATIGKTAILGIPATTNQACACARCRDVLNNKYLFYYLRSQKDTFIAKGKGGAQPNISQDIIRNHMIPLPPLVEQRRIVEQIESLFSKLDEAKEKAQEVIDGYEARSAAVYNDAFSGRLTAQWRKDNYKENKWETKRFDEVADIKSNLVEPSNYLEFPHIAPDNIEKRTGILLDYHTIAEDGVKSGKHCKDDYRVTDNDVEIPTYLESDLALEFEKLKQYGLISNYCYYISGCWEIAILPSLLTYFERKEKAILQEKQSYNTNNFYGDVTGVQIQQGTVNSSQTQTITQDFDYGAISDIIENIKKYDGMFDAEFGDKASELREKIAGLEELIEKRENPSKIKMLLTELKNLAIGVTESLIASGIVAQIPIF